MHASARTLISRSQQGKPAVGKRRVGCLCHRRIGYAFGGEVIRNGRMMHGKTSPTHHDGRFLFQGLANLFEATCYRSLVVKRETPPDCLKITAETRPEGEIRGPNFTACGCLQSRPT